MQVTTLQRMFTGSEENVLLGVGAETRPRIYHCWEKLPPHTEQKLRSQELLHGSGGGDDLRVDKKKKKWEGRVSRPFCAHCQESQSSNVRRSHQLAPPSGEMPPDQSIATLPLVYAARAPTQCVPFNFLLFKCTHVCVCVSVIKFPGARVTGACELPDLGAENTCPLQGRCMGNLSSLWSFKNLVKILY